MKREPSKLRELRPQRNFEAQVLSQLQHLIEQQIPMREIAALLNAEKYVENVVERGRSYRRLNIRQFVRDRVEELKQVAFPTAALHRGAIFLPAGNGKIEPGSPDSNEKFERRYIPRTTYFMETLSELGIPYELMVGEVDPEMVRQEPYYLFMMREPGKLAFVNNQSHNATFIIHEWNDHEAPEEWYTLTKEELRDESRADRVSIVPWDEDVDVWKARVVDQLHAEHAPVRRETRRETPTVEGREDIPDDWKSVRLLASEFGQSKFRIIKAAHILASAYPDAIRLKAGTRTAYFLSPEGEELVKAEVFAKDIAPEGWMTAEDIANASGVSHVTALRAMSRIAEQNPQAANWFRHPKRNHVLQYVRKEEGGALIAELSKKVSDVEKLPVATAEWVTASSLASELQVSPKTVRAWIEWLQSEHPSAFQLMRISGREHSPALHANAEGQLLIRQHAERMQTWVAPFALHEALGIDFYTVTRIAGVYEAEHPEWFYRHCETDGGEYILYHPTLAEQVKNDYREFVKQTEGKLTIPGVTKALGIDRDAVERLLIDAQRIHPEWIIRRNVAPPHTDGFIDPAFVAYIQAQEQRAVALGEKPADWRRAVTVNKDGLYDPRVFDAIVDRVRSEMPGSFGMHRRSFATVELYGSNGALKRIQRLLKEGSVK